MIPFGDDLGRRGFQPLTALCTIAMAGCWLWLWSLPADARPAFAAMFALHVDPVRSLVHDVRSGSFAFQPAWPALRSLVGHPLLHAGALHMLVNVLFFITCAGRLEVRAGRLRLLLFLLAVAAVGALGGALLASPSYPPAVGAGPLVAGCIVALTLLHRRLHVRWLIPVLVWPLTVEMPVLALLPVWVALQLPALLHLFTPTGGAAAMPWQATLCGGLAGLVLGPLLLGARRRKPPKSSSPSSNKG